MFSRLKRQTSQGVSPNAFWVKVNDKTTTIQRKWADYLEARCSRFSRLTLYVCLGVFCLFFASICIYIISSAFYPNAAINSIQPISVPKHVLRPAPPEQFTGMSKEYKQMLKFQKQLDSLQLYNKERYESIRKARPGLIDSLQQVLQIYKSGFPR